jgi:hypothetical protein
MSWSEESWILIPRNLNLFYKYLTFLMFYHHL